MSIKLRIKEAADNGRSYMYVLKHGLGPGMLPPGVRLLHAVEYNDYLDVVWLSRFLTADELKEYDIPSETKLRQYLGDDYERFANMY
jgi:hypothetical protein